MIDLQVGTIYNYKGRKYFNAKKVKYIGFRVKTGYIFTNISNNHTFALKVEQLYKITTI